MPNHHPRRDLLMFAACLAACLAAYYIVLVNDGTSSAMTHLFYLVIIFSAFQNRLVYSIAVAAAAGILMSPWLMPLSVSRAITQPLSSWTVRSLMYFAVLFLVAFLIDRMKKEKILVEEKEQQVEELTQESLTDPLTGLHNRRYMLEQLEKTAREAQRYLFQVSLVMADIDHFKVINDTHGHAAGDHVLQEVSATLRSSLREHDELARWGGEEFLFLMKYTTGQKARISIERLRQRLENQQIVYNGVTIPVTLTFGIAEYAPAAGLDDAIQRADEALYEGKSSGRNRVVLHAPPAALEQEVITY